jgi:transglutaminase-like putative cysteine protease
VVVARGREYGDVAPLKGVYAGTSSAHLGVTVEVTRLS